MSLCIEILQPNRSIITTTIPPMATVIQCHVRGCLARLSFSRSRNERERVRLLSTASYPLPFVPAAGKRQPCQTSPYVALNYTVAMGGGGGGGDGAGGDDRSMHHPSLMMA